MKAAFLSLLLVPTMAFASLTDLVGDKLIDARGNTVETSSLEGKLIGLYFSAEWCPPCRAFTPELVKFQRRHKNDFEVIFISSDRSSEDQMKYMKGYRMPWPAVPFGSEFVSGLKSQFEVRGIPKLVILDAAGNLITGDGRGDIMKSPSRALAGWKKDS